IKKRGLRIPISVWKAQKHSPPELLDGRNRLDAMQAVGITVEVENVGSDADPAIRLWMRQSPEHLPMRIEIMVGLWDRPTRDPHAYVMGANIRRRHLTAEQKRELIGKLIEAQPERSDRQIGAAVKVDHKTVATVRADKEARGEIPHVSARTDTAAQK